MPAKPELQLDLSHVETREALHSVLFEKLALPEYYGRNWDAFWDVINDYPILPNRLVIRGWREFGKRLPREAELMHECLAEFAKENPDYPFAAEFRR